MIYNLFRKNMVLGIIILLVGAGIIPGISSDKTVFGKTIIVDDDAVDDPVNHTWNTINEGLNDAQDGDEIWVYNGTYDENLIIEKRVKLIAQMTDLFGNDINGAVIVGAGNADVIKITATMLEISGFTIQGSGSIYAGIRAESSYNEISKNTLLLNGYGIVCSGTNTISENRIMANSNEGILLTSFEDSMIAGNKITGNGGNGLTLQSSDNNVISENIIQANQGNGILFSHISGENDVLENNISYNAENGIEIWYASMGNTLYDNIIMNNTGDGIHINHSTSIQPANTIIEKNFISNNSGFGVYLLHSKDNKISENKIETNDNDGIYLEYSNSTEISGNFITSNDDGIHQFSSRWNEITSNTIMKNANGINLDSSIDTKISSNTIMKNANAF
jgi:parallel beta-helix repeat protein